MRELRFALFGTGFWARYQLAAWRELPQAKCVALYNRTRAKAERLADEFGISAVYDQPEELLRREELDFVDIVTDVGTHVQFTQMALSRGLPVICQKPLAPLLREARALTEQAGAAGLPLLVHENWRWQRPIRRLKEILTSGVCGELVRARIDYAHSFPVFDNQPFLKDLRRFILTDIGTHILDVARFLFGEPATVFCHMRRIRPDIAGEDLATVVLMQDNEEAAGGLGVTCNLSYASRWELDRFPQTLIAVEGTAGGVSLGLDYELRIFGPDGVQRELAPPPDYPWADPQYALVQSSIVDCQRNLLGALLGEGPAETTAEDNLRTLTLVDAAYASAENACVIPVALI
ncbi:MAG: Gfo/Idh/MocA family oxidoreductase [Pirellulales bacterium]|nr:Gfo/Idh/MocA family oxidoreductase [Pirellulales bacterium]